MKLILVFAIVAALLSAGCQTVPETSGSELHAFVLEARAAYGSNRDQWPLEVQREFDRQFQEHLREQ
ncbi:MAG: hypothetical protein V2I43_26650 [Parvularcula sp.]|jgi:hypothetical protein|nr:hypothetical protein [Parvularcula sp.]